MGTRLVCLGWRKLCSAIGRLGLVASRSSIACHCVRYLRRRNSRTETWRTFCRHLCVVIALIILRRCVFGLRLCHALGLHTLCISPTDQASQANPSIETNGTAQRYVNSISLRRNVRFPGDMRSVDQPNSLQFASSNCVLSCGNTAV